MSWQVTHVDEIERIAEGEHVERIPVRQHFDIGAFGTNAYRSKGAGSAVIEEHDEIGSAAGGHEELYVVLSGHARFTVDGQEFDAPTGTMLFIRDPALRRTAVAQEDGTTVLGIGGPRGEAFRVAPWEASSEAWPLFREGNYEAAHDVLERVLDDYPGNANVLYNLGCTEAMTGRLDEAVDHVRAALAADPRLVETAKADTDLDPIRDRLDAP
jgi:hypothetical protein